VEIDFIFQQVHQHGAGVFRAEYPVDQAVFPLASLVCHCLSPPKVPVHWGVFQRRVGRPGTSIAPGIEA
jgi:hypothetical protein